MKVRMSCVHRSSCGWPSLLLLVILSTAGCGDGQPFGEVAGKVSLQGQPPQLPGLMIVFLSQSGEVAAANVELDGTYRAPQIPVGEVRVGFTIAGLGEAPPDDEESTPGADSGSPANPQSPNLGGLNLPGKQPESPYDKDKLPIPVKYIDPFKSGLKVTVKADETIEFNPDLK